MAKKINYKNLKVTPAKNDVASFNEESDATNSILLSLLLPYLEKIIAMLSGYSADRFIDESEFCQQFHISRKTAGRWRNNGLKYSMPSGKKIFYRISWIEKFIEQNSHAGF